MAYKIKKRQVYKFQMSICHIAFLLVETLLTFHCRFPVQTKHKIRKNMNFVQQQINC